MLKCLSKGNTWRLSYSFRWYIAAILFIFSLAGLKRKRYDVRGE